MKLINTTRWRRLRAAVLSEHPLCAVCLREGRTAAATEVHHITPVEAGVTARRRERLAYDVANLMPLCHGCHVAVHRSAGKNTRQENERRNAARLEAFKTKYIHD